MFGKESHERGRSENVWIEGIDDWSKMKGSRDKNKLRKLQTHFSCDAHTAALRDYANFVRDSGHIDTLLSKQQRRSVMDDESEKGRNREVIEMLIDVAKTLTCTRNGIALRGSNSDEDENFRARSSTFFRDIAR